MRWSAASGRELAVSLACFCLLGGGLAGADEPTPGTAAESGPGQAQAAASAANEAADLGEMTVTATRRELPWQEAPAMVTVIGRDELEAAPGLTVDDVLKRIPGVSSSRIHVAECGPGREITLRGIPDQKRTLVLMDGVPANDAVNGAVNWSAIPTAAVERIEVVRGPMSALYGSGAMGGVINIITRRPAKPHETTLTTGYGSLDTFTGSLLQAGTFPHGGYLLGGSLYDSDGYTQAKQEKPYHTDNARDDDSLLGTVFITPDDLSTLTLRGHHVTEDYSRGIRTDDQSNGASSLSLSYERELSDRVTFTETTYANWMTRDVALGARPSYTRHDHTEYDRAVRLGELVQTDVQITADNTLSLGVEASQSTMKKHNDYVRVTRDAEAEGRQILASAFAQDEVRCLVGGHRLILTPGVRVDYCRSSDGKSYDSNPAPNAPVDEEYPDRSWTAVNPKLALVCPYSDDTTLRLSVGRSFAAPTLFEQYTVFTRGPLLLFGNPDLDPESAWSAELGLDQSITDDLLARLTVYYTRGLDFIGYRTIGTNQSRMDNISEVSMAGLDSELTYTIDRCWSTYAGYTLNGSTVEQDDADVTTEGNDLPFQPRHRGRVGLVLRCASWLTVDLSARYEGERYTDVENTQGSRLDGYATIDLALSGAISPKVSWKLTCENLLDKRYDVYSVPTELSAAPGVLVNGSVTVTF